jgi:hypothetical protein
MEQVFYTISYDRTERKTSATAKRVSNAVAYKLI